ncbi:TonB-dependent receptor [Mariniphaga sediminis]|uniref:TonB-dependent receptor n=1 Tax=Mariniphaga sediminis TaxID=1628158 RepID=UPI0035684638
MRISSFFLLISIFQAFAGKAYSQKTNFTFDFSEMKLVDVLDEIEEHAEFYFLYNDKLIDTERKISISIENKRINEVLDILFGGTDVVYTITNSKIILAPSYLSDMNVQSNQIYGKVIDENGQPMHGVAIIIKGTNKGTVTNLDGEYTIKDIPFDAMLQFSFIGMHTQEILVDGKERINVSMKTDAIGIEEVIAIGYGTVRRSDLTGSVSTISAKDIERVSVTNPLFALQGHATGINITTNSGLPGEGVSVLIRGVQSINGTNSPIYVVDGMITSEIDNINLLDIQSVSVLKDASATAIYGSRAANGVVLITTKRGTNVGEPEITFHSNVGLQTQSNLKLDLLNASEFIELYTESYENADLSPLWTDEDLKQFEGVDTDWMDAVLQTGIMQNYNLVVSGSSEKSNYYISGGYLNHKGMVIETNYEKYSLRYNSDHKIKDNVSFGNSIMIYASDANGTRAIGSAGKNPYERAMRKVPLTRIYESDDEFGIIRNSALEHVFQNPVWQAKETVNTTKYKGLKGNLYLTVGLLDGLKFTTRGNMEWIYRYTTDFTPSVNPLWGWEGNITNNISKESSQAKHWSTDFLLDYTKTFGKAHKITGLLGYSVEEYELETLNGSREKTPNNTIQFLSAGDPDTQKNTNQFTDWSFVSFFGRLNYIYKDKYLLTATVRRDGTSRLSDGNKFGLFPSASIAWRISEEDFIDKVGFIDDMKIRASWGSVGNVLSVSEYGTIASLSQVIYVFNQAPFQGYTLSSAINSDISWESTQKKNLGVDIVLLNNHMYFNVDYFIEDTKDLLFGDPIPYSTGLDGAPYINAGRVKNTGYELIAGYRNTRDSWSYDISFNVSHVKNEVVDLKGRDFTTSGIIEGYPIRSFYGYQSNGLYYNQDDIDNSPHQVGKGIGDIWIKDVNGRDENGNLTGNPDGVINSADRGIIGKRYPDFIYGFMGTLSYKNWSFQMQLQGIQGVDKYIDAGSYTNAYHYFTSFAMNHEASILDRYHPTKNPDGKLPKVSAADKGHNFEVSDFWLKDASYLRIKNVNMNYSFNKRFCNKLNVSNLDAYISVQNLYTFTSFPGTEVDSNADPYTGVPQPTTWTLGVKITL